MWSRFHPVVPTRWPILLALAVVVVLAWWRPLDALAQAYAEDGLQRALLVYAAARGLNALISVLQGTEFSGGAVVNLTVALGQALDPVNDLIEQFSQLMLLVTVAFGLQVLLIQVGAGWGLSLLLSGVALAWSVFLVRGGTPPRWLGRLLLALLVVRFVVPVAALASEWGHRIWLADRYALAQQALVVSSTEFERLGVEEGGGARWWELREAWRGKVASLKAAAERVVGHVIDLMVVFLVQTVVVPLLVLGAALGLLRLAGPPRS